MNISRILGFGFLVMTVAAGAAQAGQQATFHLPFEARWGELTLAPGDYKVSLPEASVGIRQFIVRGDDGARYILPIVTDYGTSNRESNNSYLELVKVNGTYFVTKFRSGAEEKTFLFSVPKHNRQTELANQGSVKLGVSGN
jgi:hypothetical protein